MRLRLGCLALIATLGLLAGCSGTPAAPATPPQRTAESVSTDDFAAAAKDLGFNATDLTDSYSEEVYVTGVIMATKGSGEVDFFALLSDEFAAGVYDSNIANVQPMAVSGTTTDTQTGDGYQRYALTTPTDYWVVIQVHETVLFGYVPLSLKDSLNALITKIGY